MDKWIGMAIRRLWIVAIAITLMVPPHRRVLALQCYACSSLQEPNCWNVTLLAPHQVKGCEDQYYACMTRVTTMEGFTFIGRNCLPKGICDNTINVDGRIEDRCVTCDTDFCNIGSGAAAAVTVPKWAGGSITKPIVVIVTFTTALLMAAATQDKRL